MGRPKGLLRWKPDQPTWLEWQIEGLAQAGFRKVILVLGFGAEEYVRFLEEKSLALPAEIVVNPRPELGPFSSIQAGGERVAEGWTWVLPIDVPCPEPGTWRALAAVAGEVVIPVKGGRGGHPVRISSALLGSFSKLDAAGPEARLDFQLRLLPAESVARVPVADTRVLLNLNTPQEWSRFCEETFI